MFVGSGKKEKAKSSETIKVVEKPPDKSVKPKTPAKPLPDDFKVKNVQFSHHYVLVFSKMTGSNSL